MDSYLSKEEKRFNGRFVVVSHMSGNEGNNLRRLPLHYRKLAIAMVDIVELAIAKIGR